MEPLSAEQQTLVSSYFNYAIRVANVCMWRYIPFDIRYDAAMDALCKAAQHWDPSRSSFKGFFNLIFRREMVDQYRKLLKHPPAKTNTEFDIEKPRELPASELSAKLSPADLEMVSLLARGLSWAEAAKYLNIPLGTFKSRMLRLQRKHAFCPAA